MSIPADAADAYNITSDADQREAFRRVEKHLAEQPKKSNVVSLS